MQYSNVAGKQKAHDAYRFPAELASGKVRRLKFETKTDAADTDITIGFLPAGTTSILGISRMLASIATTASIIIPAHKSMSGEDVAEKTIRTAAAANTVGGVPMTDALTGVDIDSQTQVPVILKFSTSAAKGTTLDGELYFTYE
jgi:hypothetical protein